ncbi:MAG TPA: OmpA family protein [Myxococcota bacterium]|nr:OmpA family protein [Myxococcota bacterium]
MSATLYGAGFQQGARVRFGEDIEAARVRFEGDVRLTLTVPPLDSGRWDVWVLNPDGEASVLRNGLTISEATEPVACEAATLPFDFDSARLIPVTNDRLQELAPCLSKVPGSIRLEGHCDERGTTEYNLALGERRANTVQRTLVGLGISPDRISVVSYGEERPVAFGHDEASWAANRRVELRVIR